MCEIYYSDLLPAAQTAVLSHFKISSPSQLNLSIIPLAILPDTEDFLMPSEENEFEFTDSVENSRQMREAEFAYEFCGVSNVDDMPF